MVSGHIITKLIYNQNSENMNLSIKKILSFSLALGLSSFAFAQRSATPPERISLPKGFEIDLLYSVP